jgi:hypothetical protein
MTTSRASPSAASDRPTDEQKVREALAALSQTERLEALRKVPLSRSIKLGGASRIVLGAKQLGILGDVFDAIRSHQRS